MIEKIQMDFIGSYCNKQSVQYYCTHTDTHSEQYTADFFIQQLYYRTCVSPANNNNNEFNIQSLARETCIWLLFLFLFLPFSYLTRTFYCQTIDLWRNWGNSIIFIQNKNTADKDAISQEHQSSNIMKKTDTKTQTRSHATHEYVYRIQIFKSS